MLALRPEHTQVPGRLVAGASEPVRHVRVELGCLADAANEVVVAEHEPHRAGKNEQPIVSFVRLGTGSLFVRAGVEPPVL